MTNTEKRLELFNGNFMNNGVEGVLDDKFQDPTMLIVRDFHAESIQQALAEERERVLLLIEKNYTDEIEELRLSNNGLKSKEKFEKVIGIYKNSLLSYLKNPKSSEKTEEINNK